MGKIKGRQGFSHVSFGASKLWTKCQCGHSSSSSCIVCSVHILSFAMVPRLWTPPEPASQRAPLCLDLSLPILPHQHLPALNFILQSSSITYQLDKQWAKMFFTDKCQSVSSNLQDTSFLWLMPKRKGQKGIDISGKANKGNLGGHLKFLHFRTFYPYF